MQCFVDPPAIYLYCEAVDFRKSINGLVLLVEQELSRPANEPGLFVFCNKARDKLKVLYWDTTGFALWYKRLEQDRFKWPKNISKIEWSISEEQFHSLLAGYSIMGHQPIYFKTVG